MSVHTEEIPQVADKDRVKCNELGEGFYQVMARYGFMETPDVPDVLRALGRAEDDGKPVTVKLANTTFYLGRETLIATAAGRKKPRGEKPLEGRRMGQCAQEAFHPDGPQRPVGHCVLRASAESGGRARRPDSVLVMTAVTSPSPPSSTRPVSQRSRRALLALSLGALGVVYGDIGTSPLYALKECFVARVRHRPTQANVLGVLSLIFWALNFVVSFKYLVFIMRADNRGEGGIMALLALLHPRRDTAGSPALAGGPGPVRRGTALWRRHDHSGHLGAWRGGRARGGHAGAAAVGRCRSRSRSSSALFMVQQRGTAPDRRGVRADHAGLVRAIAVLGVARHLACTRRCCARSIPGTRSTSSARNGRKAS